MQITRISNLTGETNTRDLDVTADMLLEWEAGALIQSVMPHLSADDREFIMTGITPEEWDAAFPEEEEK